MIALVDYEQEWMNRNECFGETGLGQPNVLQKRMLFYSMVTELSDGRCIAAGEIDAGRSDPREAGSSNVLEETN